MHKSNSFSVLALPTTPSSSASASPPFTGYCTNVNSSSIAESRIENREQRIDNDNDNENVDKEAH